MSRSKEMHRTNGFWMKKGKGCSIWVLSWTIMTNGSNTWKESGIGVLMNAETYVEGMGHVRASYVQSDSTGGVLFELIEVRP